MVLYLYSIICTQLAHTDLSPSLNTIQPTTYNTYNTIFAYKQRRRGHYIYVICLRNRSIRGHGDGIVVDYANVLIKKFSQHEHIVPGYNTKGKQSQQQKRISEPHKNRR